MQREMIAYLVQAVCALGLLIVALVQRDTTNMLLAFISVIGTQLLVQGVRRG